MQDSSARRAALAVVVAVVVYLCWLIIRPFVNVLLWAGVLAIIAFPVAQWLRRRGRGPALSALLTTLLVILTVLIPATVTAVAIWRETASAAPAIEQRIRELARPDSALYQRIDRYIDLDKHLNAASLSEAFAEARSALLSTAVSSVGTVLSALAQIILVAFTLYFFIRDGDRAIAALQRLVPLESEQSRQVFHNVYTVISASVHGVLLIAALQGALGGIGFLIVGLSSPLLWGLVMFLLSMIPLAGSALIWGPAAIYLLATGHVAKAIFLILWGALVIGMLDNLLRPRLVGQKTRLHELIVFFSVLGGLQVFGMLGIVAGPVVAAIGLALADMFLRPPDKSEPGRQSPMQPLASQPPASPPSPLPSSESPTT